MFRYRQIPRSQIEYSDSFGWLEAARWRGYTNEQFADLDGDEQARIVAQWEVSMQIDAVTTYFAHKRRRP